MIKGQFTFGRYIFLFIAFIFITYFTYSHLVSFKGKNLLDALEDTRTLEDSFLLSLLSHHCFTPFNPASGRQLTEAIDLRLFTQKTLSQCTSAQVRLTLAPASHITGETYTLFSPEIIIDSFRPDVQKTSLVLADEKPYTLKMEVRHA